MKRETTGPRSIAILRAASNHCFSHPKILFPFITIAFVQLLVLEILYFAPRYPLASFFGPIIKKLMGEIYLHYPVSFIILPKLFYYAQVPIYLFISNFLIALTIALLWALNNNHPANFKLAVRHALPLYVHIVIAAFISFLVYFGLYNLYVLLLIKALKIKSAGMFFLFMRSFLLHAAPYVTVLIGVIVTSLFAFVLPLIVVEKKNVLIAFWLNFKDYFKVLPDTLLVVFLPTLCYLPILLLRNNINAITDTTFPEMRVILLAVSILITVGIDAVVYTSIATFYLLRKEQA